MRSSHAYRHARGHAHGGRGAGGLTQPAQFIGHVLSEQSLRVKPSKQAHVPLRAHIPCPEQAEGQSVREQSSPKRPVSQ